MTQNEIAIHFLIMALESGGDHFQEALDQLKALGCNINPGKTKGEWLVEKPNGDKHTIYDIRQDPIMNRLVSYFQ